MARLTAVEYVSHIKHACGGAVSSLINNTQIMNQAGVHLANIREWSWLYQADTTLAFEADQDHIKAGTDPGLIPANLRSVMSIWPDDDLNALFKIISFDQMLRYRQYDVVMDDAYYGSFHAPKQTAPEIAPEGWRLELYPTPTATNATALHMAWVRDWTEVDSTDTDLIPDIPYWMEPLYLQMVRACSLGWEEQNQAGIERRLMEIQTGPIFDAAIERDSALVPSLGELQHGWTKLDPQPLNWNPVTHPG